MVNPIDLQVFIYIILVVVTTTIVVIKFTSMFNWIYQYSGTFNQNFLLVLYQLKDFPVWSLKLAMLKI